MGRSADQFTLHALFHSLERTNSHCLREFFRSFGMCPIVRVRGFVLICQGRCGGAFAANTFKTGWSFSVDLAMEGASMTPIEGVNRGMRSAVTDRSHRVQWNTVPEHLLGV